MAQEFPVIIVGAPRSGTSLLQKIIREHEEFCSVAKESEFIWAPYVHPSQNDWKYEGWKKGFLDQEEISKIQTEFTRYAFSSALWRRMAVFNIMRYQRSRFMAPFLRAGYHTLAFVSRPLRRGRATEFFQGRLVDKSVNSAMFLSLIDQVFPTARFLHVVRDGLDTVPSMLDGWLNPSRFFTYDVPGGHLIPDYPHRLWNFSLTPGWEDLRGQYLANVVCSQWSSLQEEAISYFEKLPNDRVLKVHLEDLTMSPRNTLQMLAEFLCVPWSEYFETLEKSLPEVNARPSDAKRAMQTCVAERMARLSTDSVRRLSEMNRRLGYPSR